MMETTCLLCNSSVDVTDVKSICAPCSVKIKNPAWLFCNTCDRTYGIIDPGPITEHLTLESGETYATEKCGTCCSSTELNTEELTLLKKHTIPKEMIQ